ncbi:MAG: acyl-CoA carboxylase subunit beta [Proteobacteria bacterium]|jgi:acetyl-CoA carboxylase carboxyltransferase component|nr:acyl-CoA carboxylase subunit beta [Pseudomonadota bacterium]NCV99269.1 acyl-CoA carboxylase subunit beta [Pseudomonadota bacterium]NCW10532.1 acyl-CoA carboxylase subunit beta [Pseudomonadota bacterium]NCW37699.1 acyl-CoA carboxylase subunit beta [Pseudomonadota bacterium]NCX41688.1 acyl-CoA carboxylase subunit beta [Pseudomonadota bacterium]|tara:strand:+ start:1945 stop:3606 length:1662 start_codon:yes stop_codon:yes gene_type:complete
MKTENIAPIFKSNLDTKSEQYLQNKKMMLEKLVFLDELLDLAELGGGQRHHERLAKRGKMPVRERIMNVLDPDSPFLEIQPYAGYGTNNYNVGGGCVSGIGIISGVECVIFANDPTVKAGAMTVYVGEKWNRAMEISRDNHIPFISFVESAGGDLSVSGSGGGENPPEAPSLHQNHFASTGRFFYDMTELSKLRIPVISVVFGSSTAGGAYQPGMSDYNIFIKGQSKAFLAGPPLVKMATGEESDDETLGGAKMHSEQSGLSDYLAEDEMDALRICREVVSHLNWNKKGLGPQKISTDPIYNSEELLGIISEDLKSAVDIREIIARFSDGSKFEEFKPLYGPTMVCGWTSVHGYQVGILGNNGPIYPESAEKAATFIQLCNKRNIPLIFLHNVTGFLVGKDFESQGIIKKGSQLINAVSNSTVPHITFIVGASYGAGTYAMSGKAFNNRFTFLWPTAKIAVMGPEQMAGVMSIVRKAKALRDGKDFDEKADDELKKMVIGYLEKLSRGLVASSMVTDDGIIDPRDTRDVIGFCLSIINNIPIEGAREYGVFRL